MTAILEYYVCNIYNIIIIEDGYSPEGYRSDKEVKVWVGQHEVSVQEESCYIKVSYWQQFESSIW